MVACRAAALSRLQEGVSSVFKKPTGPPKSRQQQTPQARQSTLTSMGFGRQLDQYVWKMIACEQREYTPRESLNVTSFGHFIRERICKSCNVYENLSRTVTEAAISFPLEISKAWFYPQFHSEHATSFPKGFFPISNRKYIKLTLAMILFEMKTKMTFEELRIEKTRSTFL